MKNLLFLFSLIAFTSIVFAQTPVNEPANSEKPAKEQHIDSEEWHQIHFDKPIKKIEEIFYDKEKTPIEGEISRDRKSIILKNYSKRGRVKIRLVYEEAGDVIETISKSPCFIDPVIPI
ncbi:MAG: hypothetical protein AB8B69_26855 [Chitinophagales bacterium]